MSDYLFTSERLRFRTWNDADLDKFAAMNADPEVMRYFPSVLSRAESADFLDRLQKHFDQYGYCYFYTENRDDDSFLGFIGLAYQTYVTDFTPATDIGWRLIRSAWGMGYATEGAQRCLRWAEEQGIRQVISTCTMANQASEKVMQKIGMKKVKNFKHPRLADHKEFENYVLYSKTLSHEHQLDNKL